MMINPIREFKCLNELMKNIGFEVELPQDFIPVSFTSVSDRLLQLHDDNDVCFRKAFYNEEYSKDMGISGVYPGGYPSNCVLNYDKESDAYIRENSDKAYVAIYNRNINNNKFTYSIFARDGINKDKMRTYIKHFC